MKKVIGILGGISPESTIEYYRFILKRYYQQFQDYYYPEIVMYSLNFQRFTDFEDVGDRAGYIGEIVTGLTALQNAGADFILMAANSPHAVFKEVEKQIQVPMLSIVEATAEEAERLRLGRLLLLGIKFTMQATFYQEAFAQRDIEVMVPTEEEQDEINRIIFEELSIGIFKTSSKSSLLEIIGNYFEADGVILGCTELPLILNQEDTDVPLLNTLELHAEAALNYALENSEAL